MQLNKLYQEIILEHNSKPQNYGKIDPYTHEQLGHNPLCGDKLILYVDIQNSTLNNIAFEGEGCAILKSSTSILTQQVKGKSLQEVQLILEYFIQLISSSNTLSEEQNKMLRKLSVFEGVRQYPERVKCALLSTRTLETILQSIKSQD